MNSASARPIGIAQSFRMYRTVTALMLREMSSTYGRSLFGYLWVILEPAAGILLLTLIFSLALRQPSLGDSFALFYATGFLPLYAYMMMSQKISSAIRYSRQLLTFPCISHVDALLARFFLEALTQLVVAGIVITCIIYVYDLSVQISFPHVLLALVMSFVLGFGIGALNVNLFHVWPLWEKIWAVLTRPLFFISAIFYLFESVPMPFRDYLWFNPIVHIVGMFRKGIYSTYEGDYVSMLYIFSLASATTLLGLLLLRKYYRFILNH